MRFDDTTFKQYASRVTTPALLTLALALVAVGVLMAAVAAKRFKVQTTVDITFCEADGQGGWKVIDHLRESVSFVTTANELAASREFTTQFTWSARSEKGCQISGRATRPVAEKWDKTSGAYTLTSLYDITVNGQTFSSTFTATTGTIQTPLGSLTGQPASWANNTLTAGLVGVIKYRANSSLFNCRRSGYGRREGAPGNNADKEFVAIVKTSGKATAVD